MRKTNSNPLEIDSSFNFTSKTSMNSIIFQRIKRKQQTCFGHDPVHQAARQLDIVEEEVAEVDEEVKESDNHEDNLILFNMVVNMVPFTQFASSRLIAMEIITHISKTLKVGQVSDSKR